MREIQIPLILPKMREITNWQKKQKKVREIQITLIIPKNAGNCKSNKKQT